MRGEMRRLLGADSSMVTGGDRAQYVDMFESARISKGGGALQTLAFVLYICMFMGATRCARYLSRSKQRWAPPPAVLGVVGSICG